MASGVNSTFRQVGIAAGIAALGSVLTAAMQRNLGHAGPLPIPVPRLVNAIRQGQTGQLLASLPPAARARVGTALRAGYAAGLNDLLIITGCVALAGAVCALLLIRSKDFQARNHPAGAPPAGERAVSQEGSQIPS